MHVLVCNAAERCLTRHASVHKLSNNPQLHSGYLMRTICVERALDKSIPYKSLIQWCLMYVFNLQARCIFESESI